MSKPSLPEFARQLSLPELEQLLRVKRFNPQFAKLETRRQRLVSQIAELDRQIAELSGETVKTPKKRGRKPGRKSK